MTAELAVQSKKIGRPKGARSAPRALRAARWVERHLGDEAAVPPSPLAARLLALAREAPDRFALYLDQAEMQARPAKVERVGSAAQAVAALFGTSGAMPTDRRVRNLSLGLGDVRDFLNGRALSWIASLPDRFRVAGVAVKRVGTLFRVVVTIHSEDLAPYEEDQGVPEWRPENCAGWK